MILGDLGAEVIKVERPGSGDDTRAWGPPWAEGDGARESAYYLCANRNKRSIEIDLANADGRALVRRLAREADVIVENFAAGTMERWGIGYDALAADNPALVFCSITGYGSDGPEASRPGYDFALQARGGWMAVTGEPDGAPMKVGVAIVDVLTGQNAAIGILAALRERDRSGRGQRVEVSLLDSAAAGLVNVAQAALVGADVRRWGNAHATIVPYQAFEAADRPLVIAVGNDGQWRKLCDAIGLPALGTDPRFATNPDRVVRRDDLLPRLAERLRERPAAEWIAELRAAGVPCEIVQRVEEVVEDPTLRDRGGFWEISGRTYGPVDTIASPIRLSRTPAAARRGAPSLGEHNTEIASRGWGDTTEPER